MNNERALPGGGASPALRDRFLTALDADDHSALRSLSGDLRRCTDILPSTVCAAFGLPPAVPTRKPQRQSSRHMTGDRATHFGNLASEISRQRGTRFLVLRFSTLRPRAAGAELRSLSPELRRPQTPQ
jgi:hypothetical protein